MLSIAIGKKYKCPECGIAFLIIGSSKTLTAEFNKCPRKGCNGVPKPTRLGWV